MTAITTRDGTQIYYKEWGSGQPIVFSHGWTCSRSSRGRKASFVPNVLIADMPRKEQ